MEFYDCVMIDLYVGFKMNDENKLYLKRRNFYFYYFSFKMLDQVNWLHFTLLFMGFVVVVVPIDSGEFFNLIEIYFIPQNISVITYFSCFSMGKKYHFK